MLDSRYVTDNIYMIASYYVRGSRYMLDYMLNSPYINNSRYTLDKCDCLMR